MTVPACPKTGPVPLSYSVVLCLDLFMGMWCPGSCATCGSCLIRFKMPAHEAIKKHPEAMAHTGAERGPKHLQPSTLSSSV